MIGDRERYAEVMREHSRLMPANALATEYRTLKDDLEGARELLEEDGEDPELRKLVQEAPARIAELEEEIRLAMVEPDPNDEKNVLVEIRAGTGGDEAALFAGDLYKMLTRYAEERGFKTEVVSSSPAEVGGFKEVTVGVKGDGAYSVFKYEGGTHRVQRIPQTESQGRIHTSTATVAVLPEAEEVEVSIDPNDLQIDVYRSSGPGGQSVNTTDSAVRITHKPTGVVVSMQDEKSQLQNRERAMRVLRARLYERQVAEQQAEIASERRSQVGTGERSEKIRTYNFPQGRVTDHRIKHTSHNLDGVLEGRARTSSPTRSPRRRSGAGWRPRPPKRNDRARRGARRRPSATRLRPRRTHSRRPGSTRRASTPRSCWRRRPGQSRAALAADPEATLSPGAGRVFAGVGPTPPAARAGRLHHGLQGVPPARDRCRPPGPDPAPRDRAAGRGRARASPAAVLDVGTGSGAVALAIADEMPERGGDRRRHQRRGARGCAGERRAGWASQNGCGSSRRSAPEERLRPRGGEPSLRPRGRVGDARARDPGVGAARGARRRAPTASMRSAPCVPAARGRRVALEVGEGQAAAVAELWSAAAGFGGRRGRAATSRASSGWSSAAARGMSQLVSIAEQGPDAAREALDACIGAGGVALFPADGLYGLACDPMSPGAVERIHELKRRPPRKSSAVMYFSPLIMRELLPSLGPQTRGQRSAPCCRAR